MDKIKQLLGDLVVGAITEAIRQGRSRRDALDAAALTILRTDVVSDDLWSDLEAYVKDTRDFEDHGAGG